MSDDRACTFVYRCAQELLFNVVKHADVSQAKLHLSADQENLILRVQDDGQGFDPARRSRESDAPGLGLLSIRERASLLGGRLEVHAKPGQGSSFVLIMPREQKDLLDEQADEDTWVTTSTRTEEPATDAPHLRVMLVDDHRVLRSGLRALLDEQPAIHIIAEAANGVEAIALAKQLQPDLILMDVSMPIMDGIEATRQIKSSVPATRIVGLSMFDDPATRSRMCDAGAECCLSKNGRNEDLISAVLSKVPKLTLRQ